MNQSAFASVILILMLIGIIFIMYSLHGRKPMIDYSQYEQQIRFEQDKVKAYEKELEKIICQRDSLEYKLSQVEQVKEKVVKDIRVMSASDVLEMFDVLTHSNGPKSVLTPEGVLTSMERITEATARMTEASFMSQQIKYQELIILNLDAQVETLQKKDLARIIITDNKDKVIEGKDQQLQARDKNTRWIIGGAGAVVFFSLVAAMIN